MTKNSFDAVPVNLNARRRLMRAARLGARPTAPTADFTDAARVVDAVRAYKEGWQTSTDLFPVTIRTAWAAR